MEHFTIVSNTVTLSIKTEQWSYYLFIFHLYSPVDSTRTVLSYSARTFSPTPFETELLLLAHHLRPSMNHWDWHLNLAWMQCTSYPKEKHFSVICTIICQQNKQCSVVSNVSLKTDTVLKKVLFYGLSVLTLTLSEASFKHAPCYLNK